MSVRDFKTHVQAFSGWDARRKVASEAERMAAKTRRKVKAYSTQVFFKGSSDQLLIDSFTSPAPDEDAAPLGLPVSPRTRELAIELSSCSYLAPKKQKLGAPT